MRIINKTGILKNPADRDHCLQYMVAIALLYGNLSSEDYSNSRASDLRIDKLRDCMEVIENPNFTLACHDSSRRAIPGAVQIFFNDGSQSKRIVVEYPLGHRQRRHEALPLLHEKFRNNVKNHLEQDTTEQILTLLSNSECFDVTPVGKLIQLLRN